MPGKFPWDLIVKQAPYLIDAATSMLNRGRERSEDIAGAKDVAALRDQVAVLAKDQQASADLSKQMADHLNALTQRSMAVDARIRLALILGATGCLLGLVALLVGLFR